MGKKKISATEINKFTYCPYQWYYEQKHGRSELLSMARTKSGTESAFERGRKFHDRYHRRYLTKKRVVAVIACLLLLAVIAVACYALGLVGLLSDSPLY